MKKLNKIVLITIMMLLLLLFGSINVLGEGLLEDGKFLDENSLYVCETKEDGTIAIKGVTNKFDTKYKNAEELKIPDTINGKEVTSVLFRLNRISTLKKVELPKEMELLASYVFEDCKNLEEVIIPDNLIGIGKKAFFNCTKLKKIEIPNVISVGDCVFENCSSLTSIELPSATMVGEYCFEGCSSLTSIEIPNVAIVKKYAFRNCNSLTNIEMPKVNTIELYAFEGCSNLTSIEIPNVTTVVDYAFKECSSLKSIKLPAINGGFGIRPGTFEGCTSLETVTLSEGMEGIGLYAFKDCTSLKEIDVPKSVTFINEGAFAGCTNLQKITIRNRNAKISANLNINGLTIYGYKGSTAQTYANANGIKFEELPPETSNVEKAGILMAEFAKEITAKYGTHFPYEVDFTGRGTRVFNMKDKEGNLVSLENNYKLYLDCVGTLNLFIYQSTGLWSQKFEYGDPKYLSPWSGNNNTLLGAPDLFEYILGTTAYKDEKGIRYCSGYPKGSIDEENSLTYKAANGEMKPGDLIMLDGHVAMYCGWNTEFKPNEMLCPESYPGSNGLYFSNLTGKNSWAGKKGAVLRIKEEAANRIKVLDYLDTEEEITEYAKKLVEAYMKGTAEYKGLTLKRKTYNDTRITINPGTTLEPQINYELLRGTTPKPKIDSENIDGVEIRKLEDIKGLTVGQIKECEELKEYDRIEVLDADGNVIENEDKVINETGIKVRCYKKISAGSAMEIRAGGENLGEELVEELVTIVYGDTTGDGIVNAVDALAIVKNKTGKVLFKGPAYAIAGRVSESSRKEKEEPTAVDALMIVYARLGKIKIIQGDLDIDIEIDLETEEDKGIIPIYTREDLAEVGSGDEWLVAKANKIYKMDTDKRYILMNDIDLSEKPWTPIGTPEIIDETTGEIIKASTILTNEFEGNNYKIKGMTITGEQTTKDLGLFSVCSAKIEHLTLEDVNISDITYSEDAKSIIDDENYYKDSSNGAIVGVILADKVEEGILAENVEECNTPILNGCTTTGEIDVDKVNFSGMAGAIYSINNDKTLEIANCTNNINIKSNWASSGIVMYSNTDINIINCTNNGNTCGAGIIHITEADTTLRNIINNGENFYSGIVVDVRGKNINIYNSINNGKVDKGSGFIQQIAHSNEYKTNVTIEDCINNGEIFGFYGTGNTAGICGSMNTVEKIKIINTINAGNVSGYTEVGGIVGRIYGADEVTISNCINHKEVEKKTDEKTDGENISDDTNYKEVIVSGKRSTGGIIGTITNSNGVVIENCQNKGEIIGEESDIGGVIGLATENIMVVGCENEGNVTGNQLVGGIIGDYTWGKGMKIENCINSGAIFARGSDAGGILGYIADNNNGKIEIVECTNNGDIKDNVGTVGGITGYSGKDGAIYKSCSNTGSLTSCGKYPRIGGIVGSGYIINEGSKSSGAKIYPNVAQDYYKTEYIGDIIGEDYNKR